MKVINLFGSSGARKEYYSFRAGLRTKETKS